MPEAVRRVAMAVRAAAVARATPVLVVLALLGGAAETARLAQSPSRAVLVAALELVAVAALVLRHRSPMPAVALSVVAVVAAPISGADDVIYVAYFVPLVVGFAFGRRGPAAEEFGLGVALLLLGSLAPRVLDTWDDSVASFAGNAIVLGLGPVLLGRFLSDRERLHASLRARRAEIEAGRVADAERAVRSERDRIAAELHDVISRALSGMVVQASASRALVGTDPRRAGHALAAVEVAGRDALAEVRGLLGVLRSDEDDSGREPQPGLASLTALARRARRAGVDLVVRLGDRVDEVPPGPDLLAYRVVQDAVGAAREPGGAGHAEVDVRRTGDRLLIDVLDDGPEGRPLAGARERVRLLGGDLSVRRTAEGDHLVHVALPFGGSG